MSLLNVPVQIANKNGTLKKSFKSHIGFFAASVLLKNPSRSEFLYSISSRMIRRPEISSVASV
jgi:hypothetical protein